MASKRRVRLSERMPATKAALYLELLASGLRKGSAYLDPRDLSAEFELPSEVDLDMRVKLQPRRSRGRLSIELTWTLNQDSAREETTTG